jgi:DNA-binding FadR family transcriptional regulator
LTGTAPELTLADGEPVRGRKKLAEAVAGALEAEIIARGWPVGESLGSEPELIARHGVSRAVFREAVRIVEHHGAATMRRGPKGGLIVAPPSLSSVLIPATLYLDHADVSSQDLYDVRSSLELTCTRIVTENLDEAGIARLRDVLERESEGDAVYTDRYHDLHVVIADLTGNAAMRLFVETLTRLTFQRSGSLTYGSEDIGQVHNAHRAIVEAIVSGDTGLAQHRMRTHLAAAASFYYQRQLAEDAKRNSKSRSKRVNPR